jgi:exodeoxyribonuclease VII large subunit
MFAAADPPMPTLPFDFNPPASDPPRALRVAELDRLIKRAIDTTFAEPVWVEGEVSGARPASSGHLYFTLKDEREDASIDAVMYKTSLTARGRALLVDGARVRLRGRPAFWAPRGRLQLVADRAEAAGRGALLEALEKLKAKLAAEGVFADEKKRPLPVEPRRIGVVTSPSGAAIHDICRIAFRRGGARILLAPAVVQGAGAADSLRRALLALERVDDVDVIVVGRGGGSADDLGAFNDEAFVRAVSCCRVPVVSAVGHEIDVTLTDFAADVRAATPSQAAELLVPDRRALGAALSQTRLRLARSMSARLAEDRVTLATHARRLGDPRLLLASHQQSLDDRTSRMGSFARRALERQRASSGELARRLAFLHPRAVILRERSAVDRALAAITTSTRARLARHAANLSASTARLDAMSPLAVLSRGYAIAMNAEGVAIRDADDVRPGDRIRVLVANATVDADVVEIERPP